MSFALRWAGLFPEKLVSQSKQHSVTLTNGNVHCPTPSLQDHSSCSSIPVRKQYFVHSFIHSFIEWRGPFSTLSSLSTPSPHLCLQPVEKWSAKRLFAICDSSRCQRGKPYSLLSPHPFQAHPPSYLPTPPPPTPPYTNAPPCDRANRLAVCSVIDPWVAVVMIWLWGTGQLPAVCW